MGNEESENSLNSPVTMNAVTSPMSTALSPTRSRARATIVTADMFTVADIALYGYTHLAEQCDFDLTGYPAVRDWLQCVTQQPGYVSMKWMPATAVAAE